MILHLGHVDTKHQQLLNQVKLLLLTLNQLSLCKKNNVIFVICNLFAAVVTTASCDLSCKLSAASCSGIPNSAWSAETCSCYSHVATTMEYSAHEADCQSKAPAGLRGRIAIVDTQTQYDLVRGISTYSLSYVAVHPISTPYSVPMVASEWGWYDQGVLVKPLSFLPVSMGASLSSTTDDCCGYSGGSGAGYYNDWVCTGYHYAFCEFVDASKFITQHNMLFSMKNKWCIKKS